MTEAVSSTWRQRKNQVRGRTGQIELHAMNNSERHRQGGPAFHLMNDHDVIIDSMRQERGRLVVSRSSDDRGDAGLGGSSSAVRTSGSFLVYCLTVIGADANRLL